MYNARQQQYKNSVLKSEHSNAGEDEPVITSRGTTIPSPAASNRSIPIPSQAPSRRSTPVPQVSSRRSTPASRASRVGTTEREESVKPEESAKRKEPAEQEESVQVGQSLKRVVYDRKTKISPLTEWKRIPDDFRKQVRIILNDSYRKALLQIAGSTENSVDPEAEKYLVSIARKIDKNLRQSEVPGLIDSNLLNPKTPGVTEEKKKEVETKLRDGAKLILTIQQKQLALEREKEELKALKKRKEELENALAKQPEEETVIHDYVQSLMKYPSSMIYDS